MRKLALLAALSVFAASPVWASTITWTFTSTPGNLGPTATFTSGGVSITATGYSMAGAANTTALYAKIGSTPDEVGLGLASLPDEEIGGTAFIQFNVSKLMPGFSAPMVTVGSLQTGENFEICGSKAAGSMGACSSPFMATTDAIASATFPNWGSYSYYSIFSPKGNSLIDSITASTVSAIPEPASLALFGFGLLAAGAFFRKRLIREE